VATPTVSVRPEDVRGAGRIAIGAGLGLVAAIATMVLPVAFVLIAAYAPGGFFTLGPTLVETLSVLILAGAILFLLSLFVYRRGFAVLRGVDRRFVLASVLCIIGSIGFLLVLVAAALLLNDSNALTTCIKGKPSALLSCLHSSDTLGAYTGIVGFWLGWVGGVGVVIGLAAAGRRFVRGALIGGSVLYALLLVILIGPFLSLVFTVPYAADLLLLVPVLAILAPGLVWAGAHRPPATVRPA
jgi:hypothetical protein